MDDAPENPDCDPAAGTSGVDGFDRPASGAPAAPGDVPAVATPGLVAPPGTGPDRGRLIALLAFYTLLRLGLIAVLAVILQFFMPLIVALAFAVVIQLPLALLLFGGPRRKVTQALADASAVRRAERDRLHAALQGNLPPER